MNPLVTSQENKMAFLNSGSTGDGVYMSHEVVNF